jgi:phenylalanyl-tRNA synthetase beta chain
MEIKYPVYAVEFDLPMLVEIYEKPYSIQDVSRFPPVRRDISVVVDAKYLARDIYNHIVDFHEWISEADYTDVFTSDKIGKGKKSLSYSLTFQHPSKTLNDSEVVEIMDKLIEDLKQKYGAELRS